MTRPTTMCATLHNSSVKTTNKAERPPPLLPPSSPPPSLPAVQPVVPPLVLPPPPLLPLPGEGISPLHLRSFVWVVVAAAATAAAATAAAAASGFLAGGRGGGTGGSLPAPVGSLRRWARRLPTPLNKTPTPCTVHVAAGQPRHCGGRLGPVRDPPTCGGRDAPGAAALLDRHWYAGYFVRPATAAGGLRGHFPDHAKAGKGPAEGCRDASDGAKGAAAAETAAVMHHRLIV